MRTPGRDPELDERLTEIVRAGVDVVRLNFSHGAVADHARRVDLVREAARQAGRYVGVLGDLQGPKIRIDRFKTGKVQLADGAAPDGASVVEHASAHIARYKLPKEVVFVERIQRSPSGKADYRWAAEAAVKNASAGNRLSVIVYGPAGFVCERTPGIGAAG